MNASRDQMAQLGRSVAILPVASRLASAGAETSALADSDQATLDALFKRYTMERERDVHRQFLRGFGFSVTEPEQTSAPADAEDRLEQF
jgi:hypothetical protein